MKLKERITSIREISGNPAPLGLMAFGMTTVLLNLHNAGFFALGSMILAMGFFYGGLAQVLAGFMEWKKNNTFGTTAFLSYGFFWLSLVTLLVLPKLGLSEPASPIAMGFYLLIWGVFTLGLFIATLRLHKSLQIVFALLTILFFLLAWADFTGSAFIKTVASWEGILCGLSAMYTSLAQVLDEVYGRNVLPI